VLFDLDDTLFDHDGATLRALAVLRAEEPAFACWSPGELAARHRAVLEALHALVLTGRVSIETARAERFRRLLEDATGGAAPTGRPAALADRYRRAYESAWRPVAGAPALLSAVRAAGLGIAVASNRRRNCAPARWTCSSMRS
jgi:putative hydrolase of the HAD superfamily